MLNMIKAAKLMKPTSQKGNVVFNRVKSAINTGRSEFSLKLNDLSQQIKSSYDYTQKNIFNGTGEYHEIKSLERSLKQGFGDIERNLN